MSRRQQRLSRSVSFALTAAIGATTVAAVGAGTATTTLAGATPAAMTQTVKPAPPVAKLRLNASHVLTGATVTAFTRGTTVPARVKTVTFTFGDGTAAVRRTSLPRSIAHRFNRLGSHVVRMRIVDRLGRVARISRVVVVSPRPAVAEQYATGAPAPTEDVQPDTTLTSADALPASTDLRGYAMTPQNQGHIQSCTTWAVNYAMLGWYAKRAGMSDQVFAPMYSYAQLVKGNANQGTRAQDVLNIAYNQGVDTAADYGSGWATDYTTQPSYSQKANAGRFKISGWRDLFINGSATGASADEIYSMKSQLAAGFPVAIAMNVYDSLYAFHGSGSYTDSASAAWSGRHEVLAVGYDSSGLLIQNSWGTAWGDNGFFRLSWAGVARDVYMADVINGFVPPQSQGDTTAPTATAPAQTMAYGDKMNSNGVPVTVSWSGSDDTGVTGYDFYASTNGGSWTQQTLPNATATSITYTLAPGSSYRFAVRSRDAAGNVSPWMYGSTFTVADHSEVDNAASYTGNWNVYPWASADGGQLAVSATAGDTVSFTFTGSNIAWVGTGATNRGEANVYLDGQYQFTVDEYAASTAARSLVVVGNWSTVAQHTLTLEVVGTSGRPSVDVDSFIVLG